MIAVPVFTNRCYGLLGEGVEGVFHLLHKGDLPWPKMIRARTEWNRS